jgi:hypothetical protein
MAIATIILDLTDLIIMDLTDSIRRPNQAALAAIIKNNLYNQKICEICIICGKK